jgi:hypothetical protein
VLRRLEAKIQGREEYHYAKLKYPKAMCYNLIMLPNDLKLFSGTVGNHDGSIIVSMRFAMTQEEHDFAQANGLLPGDTAEIEMIQDLPSMHDLHFPPTALQ